MPVNGQVLFSSAGFCICGCGLCMCLCLCYTCYVPVSGFSGGASGKESTCNAGDMGLIPVLGRSPAEGNGNLLQYSCLGNFMDRGT